MLGHSQITAVFKAYPFPALVLLPDPQFTVAEVNHAYLNSNGLTESDTVGKSLFEVLSDLEHSAGIADWKSALEKVIQTKKCQHVGRGEYGSTGPAKTECNFINTPVLNEDGEVDFIISSVSGEGSYDEEHEATDMQLPTAVWPATEQVKKNETLHMLQKRIKEQSCLYKISSLDEQVLSMEALLAEAVAILPEGWQYAGKAAASIEYEGNVFATSAYKETAWLMEAETEIRKGSVLILKVAYLEEKPVLDEGPFLKEERKLLDSVIRHLALKIDRILSKEELEEKQRLFDKSYQLARIGTWEYDMLKQKLHWSPVTKEVHGFGPDYEPDVESTINLFKEGINRKIFAEAAQNAIEHEKPFDVELKIISGQGDERWIRATGEPEYKDGVCVRFYGISQDVSDRKQAEEDLLLSEKRFKALVQDGSDLIAILDPEGNYKYVSPTSKTVLGIPAEHFIGTNALDYIHADDRERVASVLSSLPSAKRVHVSPFRFLNSEGNWRWIESTITNMLEDPAVGGLVANSRDVTEQRTQQQQNMDSLREKETLLAEIHHRVKNNLAVVSGMLQLQASETDNEEITDKLFDSIVRIKTMANIHEQLYQSNSFSKLEFADNICSLISNIQKTFQSQTKVDISYDCDPVQLNINQAIPCSLIVNEVVTNIFKHAFPGMNQGKIFVKLTEDKEARCLTLSVEDNGRGLPENFDVENTTSLGFSLINVLTRQLGAVYTYRSVEKGTSFTIQFEKDELKGIGNSFF